MDQSSIRRNMSYLFLFKKLIYNLILDLHPICVNKWMPPICTKYMYTYYLNHKTIWSENEDKTKFRNISNENWFKSEYKFQFIYISNPKWIEYNDMSWYTTNINDTFIQSIRCGNIIIVNWCLKNKADVHINNDYALWVASDNGNAKIVKLLFDNGANFDYRNNYALRCAAKNGHLDVIKVFINKGINITDNDPYIIEIVKKNGHLEILELLQKHLTSHANIA